MNHNRVPQKNCSFQCGAGFKGCHISVAGWTGTSWEARSTGTTWLQWTQGLWAAFYFLCVLKWNWIFSYVRENMRKWFSDGTFMWVVSVFRVNLESLACRVFQDLRDHEDFRSVVLKLLAQHVAQMLLMLLLLVFRVRMEEMVTDHLDLWALR